MPKRSPKGGVAEGLVLGSSCKQQGKAGSQRKLQNAAKSGGKGEPREKAAQSLSVTLSGRIREKQHKQLNAR